MVQRYVFFLVLQFFFCLRCVFFVCGFLPPAVRRGGGGGDPVFLFPGEAEDGPGVASADDGYGREVGLVGEDAFLGSVGECEDDDVAVEFGVEDGG